MLLLDLAAEGRLSVARAILEPALMKSRTNRFFSSGEGVDKQTQHLLRQEAEAVAQQRGS